MIIKRPKGTNDILPQDIYKWRFVEGTFAKVCHNFAYNEIRTPVFEHTELFERGVGGTTDVVQKEMYTFKDKGDRSITLRPEGTAPCVRAFLENSLYAQPQPMKLFYIIPCYRHEKPQAGRLREFHQFGVEAYGSELPSVDAEIISLAMTFFGTLGITGLELNINSVGCPECRGRYNQVLKEYLSDQYDDLCETCKTRFDKNPLRILDCKSKTCAAIVEHAPILLDYICPSCNDHFEKVKQYLSEMEVLFNIDPSIVRGLDYYTKTVFEIKAQNIGAQRTVCGGGRYDGLIELLGGSKTAGMGFGLGIERLLLVMENQNIEIPIEGKMDIFVGSIGENAEREAQKLVYLLRKQGVSADKDHGGRSLKAQMKYADKIGAKFTIVLGDDEINSQRVKLKNMETGESEEIAINEINVKVQE